MLRRSLPNAVAILLASAVLMLGGGVLGLPAGQIPLALYLVIGAVEVDALLKSCLPLTSLRGFLFLTASVGFFCAALVFIAGSVNTALHMRTFSAEYASNMKQL